MKAFIYTGGNIYPENITEKPAKGDLCIACDSGYLNMKRLGVSPDIIVGDFDSLGEQNIPDGVKTVRVPAQKDFTDTQLAVNTALEEGAGETVIIGGLDGRLDHTLSNIAILRMLDGIKVYASITNGKNRVRYIDSTSTLIARSGFKYLSLIAADKKVRGVDVEGCRYPLKNATLTHDNQYAVSNEITGNCALVAVRKGALYIIESID